MEKSPEEIQLMAGQRLSAPFCCAVPCAYRLPWSRFETAAPWNAVEVVATMFDSKGVPSQWAIREGGCVLTKELEWEIEPIPSSRDNAFLKRARWGSAEEAAAFAMEFHSHNTKASDR